MQQTVGQRMQRKVGGDAMPHLVAESSMTPLNIEMTCGGSGVV